MNQELQNYINQELERGVSKETIIQNLQTQGGWSKSELEAFFGKISKLPIVNNKKITIFFWILIEIGLGLLILKILFFTPIRNGDGLTPMIYSGVLMAALVLISISGIISAVRLLRKNQPHILVILLLIVSFLGSPFGNWIPVKIIQLNASHKEKKVKEPETNAQKILESMQDKTYKIISVSIDEDKSITLYNNLKVRPSIKETNLVTEESFNQYILYLNKNFLGKEIVFKYIENKYFNNPTALSGGITLCSLNPNNITNASARFSDIDKNIKNTFDICGVPTVELFYEGKPVWEMYQESKTDPNKLEQVLKEFKKTQKIVFVDNNRFGLESGYIVYPQFPVEDAKLQEILVNKKINVSLYTTVYNYPEFSECGSEVVLNKMRHEVFMELSKKYTLPKNTANICSVIEVIVK
jgi:ABC-type transport system involved in multi-copper enzyme maturation permease subunit